MRTFNLVLTLLLSLILTGCKDGSESYENNQVAKENVSVVDGERLFIHYCSPCHGESGDGFGQYFAYGLKPKPPDFTSSDFLNERSDEVLFLTISEGTISLGKSNLCPPWGHTIRKEEIIIIADYVKYLNEIVNVNNNDIELPGE